MTKHKFKCMSVLCMQHIVLTSAMSVKSSLEYTTLWLGKSAVLTCWGVEVLFLSWFCCSRAAQPSRVWLHELERSTALSHDCAVSPSIASKPVFTPILSLSLLMLQTMHAFVFSSSGLERPAINTNMYMQLEEASSLNVQPLAGGPSIPTPIEQIVLHAPPSACGTFRICSIYCELHTPAV